MPASRSELQNIQCPRVSKSARPTGASHASYSSSGAPWAKAHVRSAPRPQPRHLLQRHKARAQLSGFSGSQWRAFSGSESWAEGLFETVPITDAALARFVVNLDFHKVLLIYLANALTISSRGSAVAENVDATWRGVSDVGASGRGVRVARGAPLRCGLGYPRRGCVRAGAVVARQRFQGVLRFPACLWSLLRSVRPRDMRAPAISRGTVPHPGCSRVGLRKVDGWGRGGIFQSMHLGGRHLAAAAGRHCLRPRVELGPGG